MQKALYDAYIDVLIEEVGVDTLLKAIEKFPGSKLIIDAIKTWDCPYPPLFSPPAASFMSTLSLDFAAETLAAKYHYHVLHLWVTFHGSILSKCCSKPC